MQYLIDRYKNLVNADMMIRYTNAMYGNPDVAPRLDEIRDMFSSGQLLSKFWLIERLERVIERAPVPVETIALVGGWYGNLAYYLHQVFPEALIVNIDIDPRCAEFMRSAYGSFGRVKGITADMYTTSYKDYDLVINTACEHIPDLNEWLSKIPKGKLVALQTNNADRIEGHINCSFSLDEFRMKANLPSTEEVGEFKFPMYTRYMVVGRV